jgi:hypothetical protein
MITSARISYVIMAVLLILIGWLHPGSAGCPTCRIADCQIGRPSELARAAGLATCDTADLAVCATVRPTPGGRGLTDTHQELRRWTLDVGCWMFPPSS